MAPGGVGQAGRMNDQNILTQIRTLVAREDQLRDHGEAALDPDDRARLADVEHELDQCWDLLRQRRAKRDAGEDPAEARPRPEEVVERYVQ